MNLDVNVKVGNNFKVIVIDEVKFIGVYYVVLDKWVIDFLICLICGIFIF